MEQRECPVCRHMFTPTNHNQRFCPPTQEQRARVGPNTQPRSRCAKRAENAKRSGSDPQGLPLPEPYACAECGQHCIPGGTVAAHATRFCSRRCKQAWHKEKVEIPGQILSSVTAEATPHQVVAYLRAMRSDPCPYCGAPSKDLDHIEPRELGGGDEWWNRSGACSSCNQSKWLMPMLLFLGYRTTQRAFAPWRDVSKALRREYAEQAG